MKLQGKVAVVTGAGSGVGLAIARRFASEGARLVLVGRRPEPLHRLVAELGGTSALAVPGDVGRLEFPAECLRQVERRFDGIDILVNNAGAYLPGPVLDSDEENWAQTLATNLAGPRRLAREFHPSLVQRGGGAILNVSSTLSLRPVPGAAAYCVSKAALDMLTRVLAVEWAQHQIRVNSLLLGIVDTPIHAARGLEGSAWKSQADGMHPIGRMGLPTDAAAAALFLCSDEASWITGSLFTVDGGISLV